jgi:uncharacterized damage-inducible protein DinB
MLNAYVDLLRKQKNHFDFDEIAMDIDKISEHINHSFIDAQGLMSLYSYNAYANCLLMDVMAGMSQDQLSQDCSPSHQTALNLVLHMYECESWFLKKCQLKPFQEMEAKTIPEIDASWKNLQSQQLEYISALQPADLLVEHTFEFTKNKLKFPIWQLLTQAVIHSIHHRGELSIVLTGLGFPLPTLDIILHFAGQSGLKWE